jgi:hypothetical protein
MDNKTALIPLGDISAVMCNYARPKSARSCVKRLKELGLKEIIVWNNGAKPIPEATINLNQAKNKGPIGKYHAALKTSRPYVLIVDDDHLITASGLRAFRKWGLRFPAVAQNGSIFEPPFTDYNKRVLYRSNTVRRPQRVDMVQPNMGLLIRTDLYRRLLNHWAWGAQKVIDHRPGIFSTDLEINCAIWDLTKERPVVIPAEPKGFQKLPDEAPEKALMNQAGIYNEKSKALRWLVRNGWQMLRAR